MSRHFDHCKPVRRLWLAGLLALVCLGVQAVGPVTALVVAVGDGGHLVEVRNLDGYAEVHLVHPILPCSRTDAEEWSRGGQPVEPDHVWVFHSTGFGEEASCPEGVPVITEGPMASGTGWTDQNKLGSRCRSEVAMIECPALWRGGVMRV